MTNEELAFNLVKKSALGVKFRGKIGDIEYYDIVHSFPLGCSGIPCFVAVEGGKARFTRDYEGFDVIDKFKR